MKKWYGAAGLVCTLGVVLMAQTSAPKPPAPPVPKPPQVITPPDSAPLVFDVTRVNILYTVTDRKGKFISDLTKNDFEVYEGKNRQNILEFTAESDLPLRLAVLIDTSNSIRDRFRFQQEAATEFVRTVMRGSQDRAVIVSFDTDYTLQADLTEDVNKLESVIHALRPGGGTSLYDAIFYACRDKLGQDQPRHKFRRAMVILSDGDDNQSKYSRDQALEQAQKADVVVYTISTNITRVETDGDKVLKYFSEQTGGHAFFPFKVEDLEQSFENIANEMRHQYNLLYRPEPLKTDGLYHKVDVRVKGRRDMLVRARDGYYAPKL